MKILALPFFAAAGFMVSAATAEETPELLIDGVNIVLEADAPDYLENISELKSGWLYRSEETRALQADDFDNPGFVFIEQALDTFETVDGKAGKSCASCHEDIESFAGLKPTLPRLRDGKLETIEELVNTCRTDRMQADVWGWSGVEMTSMSAAIGLQSRGMPINVQIDGDATKFWETGRELYYTRVGQLNMACANCHEDNYGNMIRADRLSQGQINGFPTYRLKNAKMNSVHSRFKGCMRSLRAEPFKEGSDEFKALELYIASRGKGLAVETPSVRN